MPSLLSCAFASGFVRPVVMARRAGPWRAWWVLAGLVGACTAVQADVCFTVLDGAGRVLHQSRTAPVDMSQPIGRTLYSRFPGASVMVFGSNNDSCEEIRPPAAREATPASAGRRASAAGMK